MDTRIAELKNNLSRFLKRMTESGEPITVYDRQTPIAKIIPIPTTKRDLRDTDWGKVRDELKTRAKKAGVKLTISEHAPKPLHADILPPQPAPDGRLDINSVHDIRSEKDY